MAHKLPKWLTVRKNGVVVVDPDIAYPLILKELGVAEKDVDQYWIEVAYQCAKMATQDLIFDSEYDPRPKNHGDKGSALVILIEAGGDRKDRWALKKFPVGKGIMVATKGLEAKGHYARIAKALAA